MSRHNRHRGAVRIERSEPESERVLTITELAKYLGIRRHRIYAFLTNPTDDPLPASRIGRSWRINLYQFQDWMCRQVEEIERHKANGGEQPED